MSETVTGGVPASSAGEDHKETASADTASKLRKRKIMFLGVVILLLVIGGVAVGKFTHLFHFLGNDVSKQTKEAGSMLHPPIILGIPTLVSNLDSGDGRTVYVKLTAKVEIVGAKDATALQDTVPVIQDIFQTYLHETRPQDIRGNGIYRLREAILRRLQAELAPLQVTNLYLVEFLVQ
ncbi:flagellar basal body-associated FliL family protein [Acetobacter sp. TBRC 12305]|uniref:Flagellar protein FliL n=1 Tax=Acetobacter garciniae TaxID=2817435 RepID=A0A939KPZ4_9PROT|nr:flagellar basal body-associated FliL family protein [Acetobacter garciniae]MBO1324639.1 flagellar basal body-associated FliL family protein [Acetobacter garciniae]MBX0344328.1 flagellar basal body-associated FliL family protein [Acetobacter garciniae]